MRKSLPYYGKLFSLFYDYSKASFILTLNKSNIKEGTKEFNAFLQTNGIQNETWLENLITQYTQPTPAP